jgi:hypothetical protein
VEEGHSQGINRRLLFERQNSLKLNRFEEWKFNHKGEEVKEGKKNRRLMYPLFAFAVKNSSSLLPGEYVA